MIRWDMFMVRCKHHSEGSVTFCDDHDTNTQDFSLEGGNYHLLVCPPIFESIPDLTLSYDSQG
jgi:hypothetical protein